VPPIPEVYVPRAGDVAERFHYCDRTAEAGLEDRAYSAWTPACPRVAVEAGFPGRAGQLGR